MPLGGILYSFFVPLFGTSKLCTETCSEIFVFFHAHMKLVYPATAFSVVVHIARYVYMDMGYMPSHHLWQLNEPLMLLSTLSV